MLSDVPPILQQMLVRLKHTPTSEELALLANASGKDLRVAFELLSNGVDDDVLLKQFLRFRRGDITKVELQEVAKSTPANPPPQRQQSNQTPPRTSPQRVPQVVSPQPPPSAQPPQPPPSTPPPQPPPSTPKPQEPPTDYIDVSLERTGGDIILSLRNKHTAAVRVRLAFMADVEATYAALKDTTALAPRDNRPSFECVVPPLVTVASIRVTPTNPKGPLSLRYETTQEVAEDKDGVTERALLDGLSLIVRSTRDGYDLSVRQTISGQFNVRVDLKKSTNLSFHPGPGVTLQDMVATLVMEDVGLKSLATATVTGDSHGSCLLDYQCQVRSYGRQAAS